MTAATDPRLPYRELDDTFLAPRDPVLGYIKVGGKSPTVRFTKAGKPWVVPIRLLDPARFEVTTREKRTKKVMGQGNASGQEFTVDLGYVRDEDFHALNGVGEAPNSLRIRLLYPTWKQNLIAFLGAYGGREWVCRGNGVEATDVKRGACVCPCPRLIQFSGDYEGTRPDDRVVCKPHGQLNVLLEDAGVFGGFWALKTTSYGTISNLIKSLQMFEKLCDGRIDGLPLELRVMAVTMQVPGGGTTVQPQVTLVLPASMNTARQVAADAAAESRKFLPAGGDPMDETKYLEAVVSEMEGEAESYAREFMPAEVLEDEEGSRPEVVSRAEDGEGNVSVEVQGDGDVRSARIELTDYEEDPEPGSDDSGQVAENRERDEPNKGLPSQPDELPGDSDRNDPEGVVEGELRKQEAIQADFRAAEQLAAVAGSLTDDRDLARRVLVAAGWEEKAIEGRIEYHVTKRTLDELLDRLERGEPDAWAKVTTPNLFEGLGEPEDGLES